MRKVADLASQHEHQVERRFVAIELGQTAGARIMLRRSLASEKINWEWWACPSFTSLTDRTCCRRG